MDLFGACSPVSIFEQTAVDWVIRQNAAALTGQPSLGRSSRGGNVNDPDDRGSSAAPAAEVGAQQSRKRKIEELC